MHLRSDIEIVETILEENEKIENKGVERHSVYVPKVLHRQKDPKDPKDPKYPNGRKQQTTSSPNGLEHKRTASNTTTRN